MSYIMAGSAEGQIYIWNLNTTKLEKILSKGGHEYVALKYSLTLIFKEVLLYTLLPTTPQNVSLFQRTVGE